ncbi:MAG: glutamyl-tRNA synthetase [Candidatus Bathyarchaeota archaeon B63]|nr:MAG: glutamyl-tRNA synthetase [Candidatus Bathyarchaeota archaeon B63]
MGSHDETQRVEEAIRRIALENAIKHGGRAELRPVLGRLLAENPDLRRRIREISSLAENIVKKINLLTLEQQIETARRLWPMLLREERERIEEEKKLPPLPNVERYGEVVTRFAPNPDCVLHIGSARAIILSHEYARMYDGRFILRFEDTDPRLKRTSLEFYDLIREDLKWLGCTWDEEYIQSDRMEIYYEYAERLLENGNAYVCTCRREEFRERVRRKEPCPCRGLPPERNLSRWHRMLGGEYGEGEAVVRIKTDIDHPNPAIREWPALRIIDTERHPHPRTGSRYHVWPLFAFANGIDDHLNGVTHVIRGKEHLTNQRRQEYLYRYLGWEYPEAIHYGRLKIVGAELSKSKILRAVEGGEYTGWDDPRLATFRALRRRGIRPEAIRRMMIDVGPRSADITLSWKNLYAYNRKIIDPIADRYFFIDDPKTMIIKGVRGDYIVNIKLHPDDPGRGTRTLKVKARKGEAHVIISAGDFSLLKAGTLIRLMELFNVKVSSKGENIILAEFHSEGYEEARRLNLRLIHWLPEDTGIPCEVIMPDGTVISGLAEDGLRRAHADQIVQFERFGFVRIEKAEKKVKAIFTHE